MSQAENAGIAEPPATLLFVDDEPSILSSLKRLFRPHGYSIHTAEGGQAGLDVLAQTPIDLVISDMRMPGMDGAHFLEQVYQRWPECIRILLTGYADMESTIAAINKGQIYRYINKPWDDADIVRSVREALEYRRLQRENVRLNSVVEAQNAELRALNAGLEQKVAERTAELDKALKLVQAAHGKLKNGFIATVQAFSSLTEIRGKLLSGHARRVADHARAIARALNLSDAELQNVLFAALLHDIGKIGMADEILDKPVALLTREQRAEYVRHAERGQHALMQIEQLRDAALIIRHHHECFDGSGFPDRLTGLAIPIGARIIAVADEYDGLVSGRLLQQPMKPKDALGYLVEKRGKRHDPAVIDVYVDILSTQLKNVIDEIPVTVASLRPGMVLSRDLMHREGYMLLAKGYVLDATVIAQLAKLAAAEQQRLVAYVCKPNA